MTPVWSIDFALRPLDEIEPWGEAGSLSLSWFALTDGYYVLRFGDAEVYRYDSAACESLGWSAPEAPQGFENTVDYQVCRLLHDLAEILPSVLEEVPADVADALATADDQRAGPWSALR